MTNKSTFQKVLYFFLTRIILGILVVAASVVLAESIGKFLSGKTSLNEDVKNVIIPIAA